jgi:lipopolysaccharide O-acetyltransferase
LPKASQNPVRVYGWVGALRLARDWAATRVSMPQARLVRRPVYIRGRRWISIGPAFTTGPGLRLDAFPSDSAAGPVLTIGRDVQVNDYVHIAAVKSVTIGDRVLIASKVFISDHNHGSYKGATGQSHPAQPPASRTLHVAPVLIDDDVWIGEFVSILPGVHIGRGSVIGAQSVVTRDVPPGCVAVGNPARVIRRFNFDTSSWEPV